MVLYWISSGKRSEGSRWSGKARDKLGDKARRRWTLTIRAREDWAVMPSYNSILYGSALTADDHEPELIGMRIRQKRWQAPIARPKHPLREAREEGPGISREGAPYLVRHGR